MPTHDIDVTALVAEREQIQQWLKTAQEREMEIRRTLCNHFFADPKEGTQRVEQDGYVFKMVQPITRKLDEAALDAVMPLLPEQFRQLGVLVKYTPGLVKAGYDALSEQDRKVFDQALTITPGAPQLVIEKAEAVNPALAGLTPDWPAKVATPIMDAYHKAKGESEMPGGSKEAYANRPKPEPVKELKAKISRQEIEKGLEHKADEKSERQLRRVSEEVNLKRQKKTPKKGKK